MTHTAMEINGGFVACDCGISKIKKSFISSANFEKWKSHFIKKICNKFVFISHRSHVLEMIKYHKSYYFWVSDWIHGGCHVETRTRLTSLVFSSNMASPMGKGKILSVSKARHIQ